MEPGDVNLRQSGFGDPSQQTSAINSGRSDDISRIVAAGRGFLESAVPAQNVILDGDFSRYIPLFNKDAIKALGDEKIRELYDEYRGRFSMQHPIKIVIRQPAGPTDVGAYYPPDQEVYKVIRVLPPMYHRVKTLNELGPRVCALIDAFFNTSRDNDVQHKMKNAMYAKAIAEAIHAVNSQDDRDATLKEFIELDKSVRHTVASEKSEEDENKGDEEPVEQEKPDDNKSQDTTPTMTDTVDWF